MMSSTRITMTIWKACTRKWSWPILTVFFMFVITVTCVLTFAFFNSNVMTPVFKNGCHPWSSRTSNLQFPGNKSEETE